MLRSHHKGDAAAIPGQTPSLERHAMQLQDEKDTDRFGLLFGCFGHWVFCFFVLFFSYVGSLLSDSLSLKHRKAARNKSPGEKALQCLITAAHRLQ